MEHASDRPNPFINRKPLTRGGRDTFLARVRKGLDHPTDSSPTPTTPPPERDESLIRQVKNNAPEIIERFVQRATGNSMTVHRVSADPAAITTAIDACFAPHKIAKAILNARELEAQFPLADYLTKKQIAVLPWGAPNCREEAFHCDAAITDCRAALADSGALLVWSDSTFGRSSTLVVPVHVILLPASRILADLIDGFDFLLSETAGKLPSNVIVINGPSKTADIEMNLVTGVHGPKYVYVIVIDGM